MIIKVHKEGVGQRSVGRQKKLIIYTGCICAICITESSNLPILKLPFSSALKTSSKSQKCSKNNDRDRILETMTLDLACEKYLLSLFHAIIITHFENTVPGLGSRSKLVLQLGR